MSSIDFSVASKKIREALLADTSNEQEARKKLKIALGSLDEDNDGEVTAEELKTIKIEYVKILKDIKICKGISNRKPLGVGTVFPNTVDSLYCHTKIENSGSKKEAKHIWYFENQIMTI